MIKKTIYSIKYIKIYDFLSIFIFLLMIIPSITFKMINKIKKRNLILVTEDGKTARDNGYYFYKYIRTIHPNDYCFYVIDKKCNGYKKVKKYGNIIQLRSMKHWLYYMSAKYNISNHKSGNPSPALFYVLHIYLNIYNNRVFLQHGITINNGEWLHYKNTRFRYFICGAKREYDFIINRFGYPKKNVLLTGFSRWDNLAKNITKDKTILIMPTWRNWLGRELNNLQKGINFKETNYFKYWNGLLNDDNFIKYIEKNNYKVYFYPHNNMQKFLYFFNSKSKKISFINTNTDIQYMLRISSIMITDYSSVSLDFGYMKKPVIYYQFDEKEYREKQYKDGYYSYVNDGYGPVCNNLEDLVNEIINLSEKGLNTKYKKRMEKFFVIRDQKNCERIYNAIRKD